MSQFVESKPENYEKQSIVEFRQSLRKYSILKIVRFFVRSVHKTYALNRFIDLERNAMLDIKQIRKWHTQSIFTYSSIFIHVSIMFINASRISKQCPYFIYSLYSVRRRVLVTIRGHNRDITSPYCEESYDPPYCVWHVEVR